MKGSAQFHRSAERAMPVAFRLSRSDHALLKERARAEGLSMQAYLERIVMGRADAHDLPPGPKRRKHQENGQGTLPVEEAHPLAS